MMCRTKTMAWVIALWLMLSVGAWAGDGQIDIAEIPYTISSSGSYIVVHDLATTQTDTNGITIDADNVTLDLNGHALIGPGKAAGSSGHGIDVAGNQYNIAIRNGTLRDWRLDGIYAGFAHNSQFEALRCYNNGRYGIWSGYGCKVNGNTCRENGAHGIQTDEGSTVSGNTCLGNDDDGISATLGSTVSGNTCSYNLGDGIYGGSGCTVSGNTCHSNKGEGIIGIARCTLSGNTCTANTGDGIQVVIDCRVVDNTCDLNGYQAGDGAGILASGSNNGISNNHCTNNDRGLDLDGADNIVSGNTLIGNTTPLDAVADNQLDILISELPYTISLPGMYRLSGDLTLATQNTNGITIDADNVTLDLNGHALIGPGKAAGTSGNGIYVSGTQYNIAIRNGTLRDWRRTAVYAAFTYNSQFESLRCYNNGGSGILVAFGCTVTDNACRDNEGDGIYVSASTIRGNACYSNTGDGIQAANSLVAENCCMNNGTNYNLTTCTSVNNHP